MSKQEHTQIDMGALKSAWLAHCERVAGPHFDDAMIDRASAQIDELEQIRASHTRLLEALRGINAALGQPATYPADVLLAHDMARAAIAAAESIK